MSNYSVSCPHCEQGLDADETLSGVNVDCPSCGVEFTVPAPPAPAAPVAAPNRMKAVKVPKKGAARTKAAPPPPPSAPAAAPTRRTYKVVAVNESGLGTIFLGSSHIKQATIEAALNKPAASGWTLDFQVIETRRFLLFWKRETMLITMSKPA